MRTRIVHFATTVATLAVGLAVTLGLTSGTASAAVGPNVDTTYVGPVTVATALKPGHTLLAVEAFDSGASFNWVVGIDGQAGGGVAVWSPTWIYGAGIGWDGDPILVSSAR